MGEFAEIEEIDGAMVRKGLTKTQDSVAIFSIIEENKNQTGIGLLSYLGHTKQVIS